MIGKREILDVAATVGLNPHVVEKDYALGHRKVNREVGILRLGSHVEDCP